MTINPDAIYEAIATELLPDLPDPDLYESGNGYDWMEQLRGTGWHPVPGSADGRLYDNWPYQVIAHHNDPERELYGLAIYTEGDVSVRGFRTRAARAKAADAYLEDDDA